jgi:hypothetical protein
MIARRSGASQRRAGWIGRIRLAAGRDNHHITGYWAGCISFPARNYFDFQAQCVLHSCKPISGLFTNLESALPKPPNYKQQKQRREDMQKKKNEAKRREQIARKETADPPLAQKP